MRRSATILAFLVAITIPPPAAHAQLPVQPNPDHQAMLASRDPALAANKNLVYDFWREVLEAGHLDLAEKYLAASYIQHNPNVPTGRAGFVAFFSKLRKPKPIEARVKAPVVAITAEGDRVVMAFARKEREPTDSTKTYTTTWFDMFRIENGMIAEHWDCDTK